MAELTEKEFSKHLHSTFQLSLGDRKLELKLVEVKGYLPKENEQEGLPQSVYSLTNAMMGEFDIFLVPVSGDESGYRYEAVFNYFRQ
jgi:hypothetical protein